MTELGEDAVDALAADVLVVFGHNREREVDEDEVGFARSIEGLFGRTDELQVAVGGVFVDNDLDLLECVITDAVDGGYAKVDDDFLGGGVGDQGASYEEVVSELEGAEGMVDEEGIC